MKCSESIAVQRIIHSIDQPAWIMDGLGRITTINAAALSAMGYAGDASVIGQNSHRLFHHSHVDGSDYQQTDCPLFHRSPIGNTRRGTEWFINRAGSIIPVQWSTTTLDADSTESRMITLSILARHTPTAITHAGRRSILHKKQVYGNACRIIAVTSDNPELTPAKIAAQLHVSLRYLQAAFTEAGESPAQRIRIARLERALNLLESGFGVREAGEQAGFSEPSTFRRLFHQHFGVTPVERRRP